MRLRTSARLLVVLFTSASCCAAAKQHSSFFPPHLIETAKANAQKYPWAANMERRLVEAAQPWLKFSDEQLWSFMFGPGITRSHMVWSSGYCPACRRPVPMYDWKIDALREPWKVRCPHCNESFPKNDFHRFYQSGIDEHGVFDPQRADRSLLFHAEHPSASDPLHSFGVDDGEGYVEGGHRWRFIGAYLQYGQFRQLVLDGITKLAAAYTVTGDPGYAHKAAILLDRVADVWPTFDFATQGILYELRRYGGGASGYVSYSIDSAYEARRLGMAYDEIFDAIRQDRSLVEFLGGQARRYHLENRKQSFADIQANIEDRILRDVIGHPLKIRTNFPGVEGTLAIFQTILDWPANRAEVMSAVDEIVAASTAVDGLSGEKGLNGYATIAPRYLGDFLGLYARFDPGLLKTLVERHPKLRETYRFYVEMWSAGQQYFPNTGDGSPFAQRNTEYPALRLHESTGGMDVSPPVSAYTYLLNLYRATNDPVYLQIAYKANSNSVRDLPHDIFSADPEGMQKAVESTVARLGSFPKIGSVDKQEWKLAVLRSRRNPDAGAVWMDYDSVPGSRLKSHYHFDALNLGLYKGLDLLPEFGYPAVQFGSWHTPQALWHKQTAAHNTVVVDGKNQQGGDGKTTLWADGRQFRAMRASSPGQYQGRQYERSLAMVNTSEQDFYVVDIFRVVGGTDHAKFTHGTFSTLTPEGLRLEAAPDFGQGTLMRHFRVDPDPQPGWSVDWKAEDRYHYLPADANVHLRYTDLTSGGAKAYTCESWTVRSATSTEEYWIPTVMTRRQAATGPLASTFVGVFDPYEGSPLLGAIRRLRLETPSGAAYPDANVALELHLATGGTDLLVAADVENPLGQHPSLASDHVLVVKSAEVQLAGEMAWVRRDRSGRITHLALAKARSLRAGGLHVELNQPVDFLELAVDSNQVHVLTGDSADIRAIEFQGKAVRWQ